MTRSFDAMLSEFRDRLTLQPCDLHEADRLKKILAVYRMVFGQLRQEDLLEYLADRVDKGQWDNRALDMWRVALEPSR